jgi:hypothetical protein
LFSHVSGVLWSMLRLAVKHKQCETSSTELVEAKSTKKWRALGDDFRTFLSELVRSCQGIDFSAFPGCGGVRPEYGKLTPSISGPRVDLE